MTAKQLEEAPRKFQVFVSSSYEDLKAERKAVIERILASGHIPSGMELFQAGNKEDFEVIKSAIDMADIFVVLVGSRFGSTINDKRSSTIDERRSFTKMEFEYALDNSKPILAFIMEDCQYERERSALPEGHVERQFDGPLRDFREQVKDLPQDGGHRIVKFFGETLGGVGQLAAEFQTALDELVHDPQMHLLGWVRGYGLPMGIYGNPFLRKIVDTLCTYNVLSGRGTENSLLKGVMAKYFWEQYLAEITYGKIRKLFFESGSTIAYLSSEFRACLATDAGQQHLTEWDITTNNALTLLDFVLSTNINIRLFPYGPPEEKYGATFGEIRTLVEAPPPAKNERLIPQEKKVVERIARSMKRLGLQLLLATTSGLELSPGSPWRGPHIGSYYNKLFKRALLTAGLPTALFLDETKFMLPFKEGYCHAVCDPEMPFDELCHSLPFALCIGCKSREKREGILETIKPLGFGTVEPEREIRGCWPLIATNSLFAEFIARPAP